MFIKYIQCIVSDAAYPLRPFVMSCPVTRLGGSNQITGCFAIYNRIVDGINSTLSIVKQGCYTYSVEKEHSCERSVCYATAVANSSRTSHFCCCNHANCNHDVALIQATNNSIFEKIETVQLPHTERIVIITLVTFLIFLLLLLLLVCKCNKFSPSSKRFESKKRKERNQHNSPNEL